MILTPLQKLPNNVGNLGKIIVATGFELLPKVKNRLIWSYWLRHAFLVKRDVETSLKSLFFRLARFLLLQAEIGRKNILAN